MLLRPMAPRCRLRAGQWESFAFLCSPGSLSDLCSFLVAKVSSPGEIMGRVHIADRSDRAPATKGIDAWIFQGHDHVPRIALSVYRSFCKPIDHKPSEHGRDGALASQLLNASPAKRFNESIWQKQREELLTQIVSGVYSGYHNNVVDDGRGCAAAAALCRLEPPRHKILGALPGLVTLR